MTRRIKKATLKDIAVALNVTTATVSKALKDSPDISRKMKDQVNALAQKIGYRPNILARSLVQGHRLFIGVIIPDLKISFFSELTRGIYEQARMKGYLPIILVNDENKEIEKENIEFLSSFPLQGLLIDPAPGTHNIPLLDRFQSQGISVVTIDRILEKTIFPGVVIDDKKAAFQVVNYIIKQGRRRILYIGPNSGISVARDRYQGYLMALRENGIAFDRRWHLACEVHAGQAEACMNTALSQKVDMDAVMCVGGLIAFGAGRALLTHNYRIPEDVVLAEFGDNDIVSRLGIPFITVNQSPYEMGKRAIDILLQSGSDKKGNLKQKKFIIKSKLIYRQTGIGHDIMIN
jgi:DNA-binding LacI/PurR family transcriptional regulator